MSQVVPLRVSALYAAFFLLLTSSRYTQVCLPDHPMILHSDQSIDRDETAGTRSQPHRDDVWRPTILKTNLSTSYLQIYFVRCSVVALRCLFSRSCDKRMLSALSIANVYTSIYYERSRSFVIVFIHVFWR